MIIDDDHMDHVLFSEKGIPHAYVPDHSVEYGVSRQQYRGRLGMRRFLGPARQRDALLARSSVTGSPTMHTTPEQARITLETTIAIERAATTGKQSACRSRRNEPTFKRSAEAESWTCSAV